MTIDVKAIAVFLPFVAAIMMGVNYGMNGRIFQTVSAPTWMVFWCCGGLSAAVFLHFLSPLKINFAPLLSRPTLDLALISIGASLVAWLCGIFAIQHINATYAAIGEISYPFFTALFVYLAFQARELDWPMTIGGLLIIAGSIVIITDKIKIGG